MFTGIIEDLAEVRAVSETGTNKSFWLQSALAKEFRVDQSVAHDGACLTVEEVDGDWYKVTAVEETLKKTALHVWQQNTLINLERSLPLTGRLDGHFVQGHVDTTGVCEQIDNRDGSYEIRFSFPANFAALVIEKGSISVNGASLTAFRVTNSSFTVAIIPFTWEHTNLQQLRVGSVVNLEFDMVGKYILRTLHFNNTNSLK